MDLLIDDRSLQLSELRTAWRGDIEVGLSEAARQRVAAAAETVGRLIAGGRQVYGLNTGFGQLANVRIGDRELKHLQENLLLSHASGVGESLPDDVVRLILLTKIVALAKGHSGVTTGLLDRLCALLRHRMYPQIPAKGSVGASGDLAPLAHMAGALLGIGHVRLAGRLLSASDGLARIGLETYELQPKEGLALINGTQVSTALALAALFKAEHVFAGALLAGAMSADAVQGSDTPFDARIHALRGHAGQADVAACLRTLMHGSEIRHSHIDCDRVQDPYSIRCQPQVMGACLDVMRHVASVLSAEADAVTDNPLIFADGDVLSGGNFHAEPVALAADYLALSIAEIGALAERRIALLIDTHLSGLPAFLVRDSGLNSGFMMPQVTAAALASENKSLAHPASVDSLPTSANQEDHVSMATFASRRLHDMLDNTAHIVAIELLAAAQGIAFHEPHRSAAPIESAITELRSISPPYEKDRSMSGEIAAVARAVLDGRFLGPVAGILPSNAA
jgi:histidine ammonia-lyase